jgi:hypothetical protein
MKAITTTRLILFGSSLAMMVMGLAGTASAVPTVSSSAVPTVSSVPEIDPATGTSGLALLAGAVLLLIERRGLRRP